MSDEIDLDDVDFNAISTKFEAVKIGLRHNAKDGYILALAMHPQDAPEEILRDPIGQQYMLVAVRMNQQSEPVAAKGTDEGLRAVKLAGTLCSNEEFQLWMVNTGYSNGLGEAEAAEGLRQYCGINSRSELKTNAEARRRLLALRAGFSDSYHR